MTNVFAVSPLETSAPFLLTVLMLASGLALVRLIKGPTLADRVVAIEVIGAIVAATIVVIALRNGQAVLIDVALLFALVSFLGSLGFARFVERGTHDG